MQNKNMLELGSEVSKNLSVGRWWLTVECLFLIYLFEFFADTLLKNVAFVARAIEYMLPIAYTCPPVSLHFGFPI